MLLESCYAKSLVPKHCYESVHDALHLCWSNMIHIEVKSVLQRGFRREPGKSPGCVGDFDFGGGRRAEKHERAFGYGLITP